MDPLTLALITQLGQAGYRYFKSSQGLGELNKQAVPSVLESKAMSPYLQNVELAKKMGQLDPTAVRLAKQQQALEAARNQRFLSDVSGGQLSGVASRLGALGTSQTALGLAGMQQAATQRGLAAQTSANMQLGQLYQQDVRNRLQQRMQKEQAYGMAKQQSMQDAVGAIGGYAMGMNANKQAELNQQFWKDMYGSGTASAVPTTTPTSVGVPSFVVGAPNTYTAAGPENAVKNPMPIYGMGKPFVPTPSGYLGEKYGYLGTAPVPTYNMETPSFAPSDYFSRMNRFSTSKTSLADKYGFGMDYANYNFDL